MSDANTSKGRPWTGRVLSGLAVLFFLMDAGMKIPPAPQVLTTMAEIGWPATAEMARLLAAILLVCTALYVWPPTSVLGAILLTGYLGGAIATHLRIESPLFSHTLFSLYIAGPMWLGLWLRNARLRALIPLSR